jgi:hypothetical protein
MYIPLTQLNDLLRGRSVTSIEGLAKDSTEVVINMPTGKLRFYHEQDCCEGFWLADFEDDRNSRMRAYEYDRFLGVELLTNKDDPAPEDEYIECYTWTYVRLKFQSGDVTLRFIGASNGYYSEDCNIEFDGKLWVDADE